MSTNSIRGPAGASAQFNGSSDYISCTAFDGTKIQNSLNLSAWARADNGASVDVPIVCKEDGGMTTAGFLLSTGWGSPSMVVRNDSLISSRLFTYAWYTQGSWSLLSGHFDGWTTRAFIGRTQSSHTVNGWSAAVKTAVSPLTIGRLSSSASGFYLGGLDEVRVEKVVRSNAWTGLCFATQRVDTQNTVIFNLYTVPSNTPPTVVASPADTTVDPGGSVTFRTAVAGSLPITYAWTKMGSATSLGTTATLALTNRQTADSGSYICAVTNAYGTHADTCKLHVRFSLPTVVAVPADTTVDIGGSVTFRTTVTGSLPITYAWTKQGSATSLGTAATLALTNRQTADSGSYICTVTNPYGTAADTCKLHVRFSLPTVIATPADTTVDIGGNVTFRTAVTGSATITYAWTKQGSATSLGTAATLARTNIQTTDSGSYICTVTNPYGIFADTCKLHVRVSPPTITVAPVPDTAVLPGANVTLRATATGTPPVSFAWYKNSVGGTALVNAAQYTFAAQPADSGARFLCVATNSLGSDTGDPITVRVITRVTAGFRMADYNVQLGSAATFTDTSKGNIVRWKWDFGVTTAANDTAGYAARQTTTPFTYADTGHYTVKLVVWGQLAGNVDSTTRTVTVFKLGINPLQFAGAQAIASTKIAVAVRGVAAVNTDPLKAPYCNGKVDIWYGRRGLSLGASPLLDTLLAGKLKEYDLSAMGADSIFRDTITVASPSTPADTVYGVWISPVWNNGMPSPYNGGNATTLFMKPVNALTITGKFLGNTGTVAVPVIDAQRIDSATVTLGGAGQIDASAIASVVVGYGFADGQVIDTTTVSAAAAKAGAQYVWRIKNARFTKDTVRVYVSVHQIGINALVSDVKKATFIAGWPYPPNPSVLTITDIEPARFRVNWTNPGQVDAIRILLGRAQAVPLGQVDDALVGPDSDDVYQVLTPAGPSDTTLLVTALRRLTKYYIGMQVLKNLHWSDVTAGTRREATTSDYRPEDSVTNTIKIESSSFDSITNQIRIKWHMQPLANVNRDIGVVYSQDMAASRRSPDSTTNVRIVSLDQATLGGETSIDLSGSIQFGATYHASLWLRSSRGPWARWTDSSVCSAATPTRYSWQRINYFSPTKDTIVAFNGTALLRKDSLTLNVAVTDTITFCPAPTLPPGMSDMGIGASFKKDNVSPLWIGFHYSAPPAAGAASLGIYRDSAGMLLAEYTVQVDSVNQIVWALVDQYSFLDGAKNSLPFLLLSDAQKPEVTFVSDTSKALLETDDFSDTFRIVDNIANVRWQLYYAKDGDAFQKTPLGGYACGVCPGGDTVITRVLTWYVTEDNGIRARLIVSDAVHADTIDVSRSAVRPQTDAASPGSAGWVPVAATARLADTTVPAALRQLAGADGWKYDSTEFRLFRWHETDANKLDEKQWLEYNAARADLFAFTPGRVMWLKTREQKVIDLGQATTMSLKSPVELALQPNQWLDMRLAFRFDIKIGDILRASGLSGDSADIYRWEPDTLGIWVAREFCLARPPLNLDSTDRPLSPGEVYTVYYNAHAAAVLRIPPIPASMSTYQKAAPVTKRGIEGWALRLASRVIGGPALNAVYCGYTKGTGAADFYPLPPSFASTSVGVMDRAAGRLYGQGVAHTTSSAWEIAYVNRSAAPVTVVSRVERLANMPDVPVRIFDGARQQWVVADGDMTVTVGAKSTVCRSIAIGEGATADGRHIAGHFRLSGAYMDRDQGVVRIRYEAPGSGAAQVRFTIHDMSGRLVWRQTVAGACVNGGVNTVSWMTRGTPAIYVLTMEAVGTDGKPAGRYQTVFADLR